MLVYLVTGGYYLFRHGTSPGPLEIVVGGFVGLTVDLEAVNDLQRASRGRGSPLFPWKREKRENALTGMFGHSYMTMPFEPGSPAWKADILTARQRARVFMAFTMSFNSWQDSHARHGNARFGKPHAIQEGSKLKDSQYFPSTSSLIRAGERTMHVHKVWRNLERVDLNYYQGHLWISMLTRENHDINIMGTGAFKVFAREEGKLVPKENAQLSIAQSSKVVLFGQDLPSLTTIKIFDTAGEMLFHLISDEPVDIR